MEGTGVWFGLNSVDDSGVDGLGDGVYIADLLLDFGPIDVLLKMDFLLVFVELVMVIQDYLLWFGWLEGPKRLQ